MRQGNRFLKRYVGGMYSDSSGTANSLAHEETSSYELISSGPIIRGDHVSPNPWRYDITKFSADIGKTNYFFGAVDNSWWYRQNQEGGFSALSNGLLVQDCISAAEDKAISKLYDALRGNLDLSIDAFQARQTARMFTATENLKVFIGRIPVLRRIGSLWLSYQYGWKPLLGTIYDVADESIRWHANKISRINVSASEKLTDRVPVVYTSPNGSFNTVVKVNAFCNVKYTCLYSTPSEFSIARWTSLNPISIAWELLPYSFVVDWLIDIGGYLRNAESAFLYADRFVSGYKSVTYGYTDNFDFFKGSRSLELGQVTERYDQAKSSFSRRTFNRSILSATPFPRPPRLNVSLGSARLFSAASLLSQFLGRK